MNTSVSAPFLTNVAFDGELFEPRHGKGAIRTNMDRKIGNLSPILHLQTLPRE